MEKPDEPEGSGGDENDRVESDPQNTYLQVRTFLSGDEEYKKTMMTCILLQVGQWIAQWDAPYEAWYYYNSQSGKASAKISS